MGIIRPATPGFLATTAAAILLLVVTLSGPVFKSVYFLKASLTVDGVGGNITFGTLGYCLELANGTTCSKPSIGYQLDVNALVGNNLPIQIPQAAVKWLTYALVLHAVALVLAAGSALFGLLAHVREFAMTCFSTCISGFASAIALFALIFDIVFFFVGKSRINSVAGASASLGSALWLTLAAWLLLFFSGLFYWLGRCCIRSSQSGKNRPFDSQPLSQTDWDAMRNKERLAAIRADEERKVAQQRLGNQGLPPFPEYSKTTEEVPLVGFDYGDEVSMNPAQPSGAVAPGGYAPAPPGTRAVDDMQRRGLTGPTGLSAESLNASPNPSPYSSHSIPNANVAPAAPTHYPQRAPTYASSIASAPRSNTPFNDIPTFQLEPVPTMPAHYPPQRQPSSVSMSQGPSYADQYLNQNYNHGQGGSNHYASDPVNTGLTSGQGYHQQRDTSYYSAVSVNSNTSPLTYPHSLSPPPEHLHPHSNNGYGDNILPPLQETTPAYTSVIPPPPSAPPSYSVQETEPHVPGGTPFYSSR